MRKCMVLMVFMMSLSGCVSPPPMYGNFIQSSTIPNDKKIVDDVIEKLVMLYPPAKTQFNLQHDTPDYFGTYMIQSLRAKGYGVLEHKQETKSSVSKLESNPNVNLNKNQSTEPGLSLSYILDQPKETNWYRITLVINHRQSLDRVYQLQNGAMVPAGYWVRKE